MVDFPQPISDYVKFYQTLERMGICLESALVRNDTHKLLGTVRVRNYCFEKSVMVKYTYDDWVSCSDTNVVTCEHRSGNEFFDIFQFELPLPMTDGDHSRVQFCLCFTTPVMGDKWDSNSGANYVLLSKEEVDRQKEHEHRMKKDGYWNKNERQCATKHQPVRDALRLNIGNWGAFRWNNLTTDEPYY